ncbi:hypothetical protein Q2T46_11590 [Thermoanaerobacterium sp. CMT5567-10]|uniref:hypothetical protein n=1 Tax=Thermoanaerobacterium sp. CMT5567-10 TaxID=3061989 RepID=UPI00287F6A9B|nr:hypothetical protein [Thermoanaerobacterium sp. CMT5567-10]WKV08169.2 hypothetical protein Q2T46_11590 [Thermoanaerobacterium sp. CMT5567-10]
MKGDKKMGNMAMMNKIWNITNSRILKTDDKIKMLEDLKNKTDDKVLIKIIELDIENLRSGVCNG